MFPARLTFLHGLAVVMFMTGTGPAWAGWITIRNDTKQELAVQEVILVNGKPKLGKATKLLPGESIKELRAQAGTKTIVVVDPAKPNVTLTKGTLEWKKDDITFAIATEASGTTISVAK